MDDATRAELAELRRRAYAPDPDIAGDAVALDRLVALESLVLDEHAARLAARHPVSAGGFGDDALGAVDGAGISGDPGGSGVQVGADDDVVVWTSHIEPPVSPDGGGMPPPAASAELDEAAVPAATPGRRGGIALVAALIAGTAVAATAVTPPPPSAVQVFDEGTRSAFTFARDGDAAVLIRVPLDGWRGVDVNPPSADEIPAFPTSGTMDWASNLGEYYGWQLWIGGATGAIQDEQCILALRGDTAKGRCVVEKLRRQSALVVSIPYLSVPEAERPPGFGPGRRIGFWWFDDATVTVLLGNSPEER